MLVWSERPQPYSIGPIRNRRYYPGHQGFPMHLGSAMKPLFGVTFQQPIFLA